MSRKDRRTLSFSLPCVPVTKHGIILVGIRADVIYEVGNENKDKENELRGCAGTSKSKVS